MRQGLNILFFIVILFSVGLNSYAQDLPLACGGSIERYRVVGSPNSIFDWVIEGGEVYQNYNDSVDILWYNIAGTRTITVTETNEYSCIGEPYSQTLLVSSPAINIGLDEEICEGETHEFFADRTDLASYLWQDGVTTETSFIASETGEYWLIVTDEYGCTNSDTANLIVREVPIVDLGNDTTLCDEGESVEFDVSDVVGTYEWFDGSSSSYYTAYSDIQDQMIWVQVTNQYGCVGQDTVFVRFCGNIEIPNAFSPNGDNFNNTWEIDALFAFPEVTVDVYNRWGDRVFHSKGYSEPWDGTDGGKKLPMDTYYYVIDLGNGAEPLVGNVTIIR